MVIKLYKNTSDPKCAAKNLSDERTISDAVARNPVDISNPIIEIEGSNSTLAAYNYAYIPDYNRYYFVSPQNDSYDLNTLYLRCDVLSSAREFLLARYATISRNERLYNAYINDPDFPSYAYTNIVTKTFPTAINGDSIILMTVG